MQLHFYRDPTGNFGDDLNPWLWPRLLPKPIDDCFDDSTLLVGIGSILNQGIPKEPARKIVFSSGLGYGPPPSITKQWHFYCVRGPLTAVQLGLPAAKAICDGAILVREYVQPAERVPNGAAYMPHHKTARFDDWRGICDALSLRYVDPGAPVEETLEIIRGSSVLITEAMHGAIVADALRVPWIPVRTRPWIQEFKWKDWSSSVGIEHEFEWLPSLCNAQIDPAMKLRLRPVTIKLARERLRWLVRFGHRRLSSDRAFSEAYDRLLTALQEMSAAA